MIPSRQATPGVISEMMTKVQRELRVDCKLVCAVNIFLNGKLQQYII